MLHRILLLCAALALGAAAATHLFAAEPETGAADAALGYVRTLQNSDGGFPAFGTDSSAGATIDATFAFAAAGIDPKTVRADGAGPDDYLAMQAAAYSATPGGAAKLVLGIGTMDLDATSFGGIDARAVMEANVDAASGKYGDDVFAQSLFILAERALGRSADNAPKYLASLQLGDGAWEFSAGAGGDTNTTALAMRAMLSAGAESTDTGITNALAYLDGTQNPDGGFGFVGGAETDPNSTALVIQAIVAAGQDVEAAPWVEAGGATPLSSLVSSQNPATGALQFGGADSPFATYQGIPGLLLIAYPELQPIGVTPTTSPPAATSTPVPATTLIPPAFAPTLTPSATQAAAGVTTLPGTGGGKTSGGGFGWAVAIAAAALLSVGAFAVARRRSV